MIDRAADLLAETCDLDGLLALARSAPMLEIAPPASLVPPDRAAQPAPLIAVAQDYAFSFTYPETRELLEAAGARVASFGPMADPQLPSGTAGVILSGGFPELYAEALSRNTALHEALRAAHAAGVPIYAECGGLMYLTEALVDQQGRRWPMVGLLPGQSVMTERLTLGYRTVRALHDGPLLPQGASVRGHEFHYSQWEGRPDQLAPAYRLLTPGGDEKAYEGGQVGSLIASYIHLHWLAQPEIARRFVQSCAPVPHSTTETPDSS